MSEASPTATPPSWFKAVAILAVIWNLLGLMAFLVDVSMTPEQLAELEEAQQLLYRNRPGWALGAFAIAVAAGTVGSILLLLRKKAALPVLVISLLAVVVQNIYNFQSGAFEVFGPGAMVMSGLVFLIGLLLILLARKGMREGWI